MASESPPGSLDERGLRPSIGRQEAQEKDKDEVQIRIKKQRDNSSRLQSHRLDDQKNLDEDGQKGDEDEEDDPDLEKGHERLRHPGRYRQ